LMALALAALHRFGSPYAREESESPSSPSA
jgi:hypothetical protein